MTSVSLNVEYPPRGPRISFGVGVHDDQWVKVSDSVVVKCAVDEIGNPHAHIQITNVGSGKTNVSVNDDLLGVRMGRLSLDRGNNAPFHTFLNGAEKLALARSLRNK